jgi:hypothetical protein
LHFSDKSDVSAQSFQDKGDIFDKVNSPIFHTLARVRGYTAVMQAIVPQLAICATKKASNTLSTVIGALASCRQFGPRAAAVRVP